MTGLSKLLRPLPGGTGKSAERGVEAADVDEVVLPDEADEEADNDAVSGIEEVLNTAGAETACRASDLLLLILAEEDMYDAYVAASRCRMLSAGGLPGLEIEASCSAFKGGFRDADTVPVLFALPATRLDEGVKGSEGIEFDKATAAGGAPPGHILARIVSTFMAVGREASIWPREAVAK